MDDVRSDQGRPPNLRTAVRRARSESAEQNDARDELRQAEVARLELLEDAIRPIVDQAPDDVELFDLGVTHGERPRLFLDMISFVDLAHDRRTFRFFQDTRHGRVLIAENESADRIVAAVTNYVARRLVEREQALAADWRSRSPAQEHIKARARADTMTRKLNGARPPPASPPTPAPPETRGFWRGFSGVAGYAFSIVPMTIGWITLFAILFFLVQAGWETWGRVFWQTHIGHPPL